MSDGFAHPEAAPRGKIARLVPREPLARDEEQRARLIAVQSGGSPALTLAQTREELSHRLAMVCRAAADCAFDEVGTSTRRLRRIGLDLGFPTLAQAAENVLDCLGNTDGAALGATVARLHRLGALALQDLAG